MKRVVAAGVAAAVAVAVGGWMSGAAATPAVRTAAPPLTAHGRLLADFEALLVRTFHTRRISVSKPENFSCSGNCAPLSKYRPYMFTFANPRGSSLHVSKRTFGDNGEFGNYPIAVLIRGRAVACNPRETHFLIAYRSTASFTLDCLPNRPGK